MASGRKAGAVEEPVTSVEKRSFIFEPRAVAGFVEREVAANEATSRERGVLRKTAARLRSRTLVKNGLLPASEAARAELDYELVIAKSNLAPAWFLSRGAECARAIAKLEARGVAHDGTRGKWHGTGFLVSPSILLTNWHVLHSVEVAAQARATFRYEYSAAGLLDAGVGFAVNPARLFVTNRELDFTFVWVDGEPGRQFGHVCLARNAFSVVEGECVNIVQHPNGRPKEVAIQDNQVERVEPEVVLYATDTEPGSSGSCVFNNRWLPVALHHASKRSDTGKVSNEGIRLAAIAAHLERLLTDADGTVARQSRELLELFSGIDEVMGFFGALGRSTDLAREEALQVVRQSYAGEAYDVDVGIWRLDLGSPSTDLGRVAEAMVRMNLDVWALVDVSEHAVRELLGVLSEQYGLTLELDLAPSAVGRGTRTAVVWNARTVSGRACRWPLHVEGWWTSPASDSAPSGSPPPLFQFRVANRDPALAPFEFFLVPLGHAAAPTRASDSRVLTAAVYAMARESGNGGDWLIGGSMDARRFAEALRALAPAGLVQRAIAAPFGTGLVHLRGTRSSIDTLYLPAGYECLEPSDDGAVIAGQSLPELVLGLSEHPLLAARASLVDQVTDRAAPVDSNLAELERTLDELSRLHRLAAGER